MWINVDIDIDDILNDCSDNDLVDIRDMINDRIGFEENDEEFLSDYFKAESIIDYYKIDILKDIYNKYSLEELQEMIKNGKI